MKVVILAGGMGTRIGEETRLLPKPMIEIGGRPILWHIMKYYFTCGFNEFVICLGYRGDQIRSFFLNYDLMNSDFTVGPGGSGLPEVTKRWGEPWRVTLAETGLKTMTGGRLARVRDYLGDEPFLLTYGDGVADVDLAGLVEQHRTTKRICTLTAVRPAGRFGVLEMDPKHGLVESFKEKSDEDVSYINGGFMVVEPKIFDYIEGDATVFESDSLERVAHDGQLGAYRHDGFWQCMDTLKDRTVLNDLWDRGAAPWKVW